MFMKFSKMLKILLFLFGSIILCGCSQSIKRDETEVAIPTIENTEKDDVPIVETEYTENSEESENNIQDNIVASVSIEELLQGNLTVYERFDTDEYIFEWLISDYSNTENIFVEDAVLVISSKNQPNSISIIHVQGEGAGGISCSNEERFIYEDVNFDKKEDLLICTGSHGVQGVLTYYSFLQTDEGFIESPEFTCIANPKIDSQNQLILSQWRNSAASHSWAEYEYVDGKFIIKRTLTENVEISNTDDSDSYIYIWDVDGIVIGRSDQLSDKEIDDLIYNEKSDWGLDGERWQ